MEQLWGRWKVQPVWPMTILDAWICFSYYWPANTPSPSPFCCDRGCALTIQELLRKGAEGNDSHLREGRVPKKKTKEITNIKEICKCNHYMASRRSSLALGCVVSLSVWVGMCGAGNALEAVGRIGEGTQSLDLQNTRENNAGCVGAGYFCCTDKSCPGLNDIKRVPHRWDDLGWSQEGLQGQVTLTRC